ncbi:hypothetical protein CDL12_28727 [Handroanthus impetiginosus]|uniref:Uncharacterized protein n=1 Tax=Handroanthus impetiginosus TaxID=429701 RepID=A0A2G9G0D7_9LAMI|nr:hypothetical protein CDL12_28727 [Handroanthus impetiginosus]
MQVLGTLSSIPQPLLPISQKTLIRAPPTHFLGILALPLMVVKTLSPTQKSCRVMHFLATMEPPPRMEPPPIATQRPKRAPGTHFLESSCHSESRGREREMNHLVVCTD